MSLETVTPLQYIQHCHATAAMQSRVAVPAFNAQPAIIGIPIALNQLVRQRISGRRAEGHKVIEPQLKDCNLTGVHCIATGPTPSIRVHRRRYTVDIGLRRSPVVVPGRP
jgi:hypothetical protein